MSNENLLFNELNANESDAIKGGNGGVKKSYKDSYNSYKNSYNKTNTQTFSVGGDLIAGNGDGSNRSTQIGNF